MCGELTDLIFPQRCAVCGGMLPFGVKYICDKCLSDLPFTYFWSWRDNPAEQMLWGRAHFDKVCSLFYYSRENNYSSLVRRLKYFGDTDIGIYLGAMLGSFMRKHFADVDYIVPVPVHFLRRWKRGYNQSEFIAYGIKEGLRRGEVIPNALYRCRYAPSQTSMSMGSKWENMNNSFRLKSSLKKVLEGSHILLADDVLTSGATSEVCFNALSCINGVKISLATLAFVQR